MKFFNLKVTANTGKRFILLNFVHFAIRNNIRNFYFLFFYINSPDYVTENYRNTILLIKLHNIVPHINRHSLFHIYFHFIVCFYVFFTKLFFRINYKNMFINFRYSNFRNIISVIIIL